MPVFVPGQAGSLGVGVGAKIGKDIGSRFVRHGGIRNWNTHLNLYGQGTMAMKSHPNYGFPAGVKYNIGALRKVLGLTASSEASSKYIQAGLKAISKTDAKGVVIAKKALRGVSKG